MASLPIQRYTPEQYLEIDRRAEFKSEYLNSEIFAMAGASRAHNLIANNISAAFNLQLRAQPCETYASDMRVQTSPAGLYTFPDVVVVVCGEPQFRDDHADTLLNPTVIVEVLSPTTEAFDRGEKFAQFRRLPSLTDYLLVSQTRPFAEHFTRTPDGLWLLSEADGLAAQIAVPAIDCTLLLADIYRKVAFAEQPSQFEVQ